MTLTPSPFRTIIEAMFRIVDKDGRAVDFRLNDVQARLDAGWSRRNIVPKARQPGVSSLVIARYLAKCLSLDNRVCVIVSHEADATQRLLKRAYYILDNLKVDAKPELGRHSANEVYFKKTNSTIYIGTAGAKNFGHGDTITDLHLSEAARYADPETIVGGTFPAAERGEITVESTGNGVGNWFHRQCVRAREGIGFKLFFFPWIDVPEYVIPVDDEAAFLRSLDPDIEEVEAYARGLTVPQLAWRRERINIDFERDLRAFKQAYPIDFDECFQSTGFGFFNRIRHVETDRWERVSRHLWRLSDHPRPGMTYVIGNDSAGGNGGDNAVNEVFCLQTREQVAEWASNQHEPDQFADETAALGRMFNNAYINPERNNHGIATIARLVSIYPIHLIHRATHGDTSTQEILSRLSHYGTMVGPSNRGIIIGTARRMLAEEYTIHSPALKSELGTFIEKEDGKVEADSGCHDDRVMATCHALSVVERAGIVAAERPPSVASEIERDPFCFDALFGKQTEPGTAFPINMERYG